MFVQQSIYATILPSPNGTEFVSTVLKDASKRGYVVCLRLHSSKAQFAAYNRRYVIGNFCIFFELRTSLSFFEKNLWKVK
ncbi:MAG: hypothetical protein BWY04_01497 [candidate division CPR1 bacterium ADurb.Bin160]|uniref:Uncharacterized protein n=1 Tax=candidate division CPR1 bacterium ADurb.Bin160 TaxID=1852826 RepID=A0A1V5ZI96_9BACT|nr:MAG: hypothetical protein BWY04_01497 [candidate division CPR1 bacterium ADurb.Bin160]